MAEAIVGRELFIGLIGEDYARAWHPIGFLAVDEMTDYIEGTERFRAFVAARETLAHIIQQRVKRRRRSEQNVYRFLEIEAHAMVLLVSCGINEN